MKHVRRNCIILFLFFQIVSCNDKWAEPTPSLSILDNKIVCENCDGFGSIIEADGNNLVVEGGSNIYVFEKQNQELILK